MVTENTAPNAAADVEMSQYVADRTRVNEDKIKKDDEINHTNEYSGVTTVQKGSILEVIGNDALGTEKVHTNALYLHDNSQFNLGGYSQTIGSLNQYAAALSLNGEKTDQLGSLNILQKPNTEATSEVRSLGMLAQIFQL